MAAKTQDIVESRENNADLDADAAINQRLTRHLVENAAKDRSAPINVSSAIYASTDETRQPSSPGGMFQQAVAIAGVIGLMVVLSLMSVLDRKHRLL